MPNSNALPDNPFFKKIWEIKQTDIPDKKSIFTLKQVSMTRPDNQHLLAM